jgi:hypothetical protein
VPVWLASLLLLGCLAGGAWLFYSAFGRLRLWRLAGDTPTSKARSAAMGLVELSGVAAALERHPSAPAPLTGLPCVWWHLTVEEEEVSRDARGARSTRWVTLYDERSVLPFEIRDATGSQQVDPVGAQIDTPVRYRGTIGGLFGSKLPAGPAAERWAGSATGLMGRRRRLTERRIEPSRPLYALGLLVYPPRDSGLPMEPALRSRQEQPLFLATSSEAEMRRGLLWSVAGRMFGGALLLLGGLLALGKFFIPD